MKKLIYLSALFVLVTFSSFAQTESNTPKFGLKAGYSSLDLRVKVEGVSVNDNADGFYIGAFGEFFIKEQFYFQPELLYANYSADGESSDVLFLPLLLKYKPANKIGLLFGPQLDFLLNEEDTDFLKTLGFGLALGAAYEITDNFIIDARYSFGLNDRFKSFDDEFGDFFGNVKANLNYFQIGLAYRF